MFEKMINGVELVDLPKIKDPRGNLSFFENNNQIPFEIKGHTGFMTFRGRSKGWACVQRIP